MQFIFTPDQNDFREVVRRFFSERAPLTATGPMVDTAPGTFDPMAWKALAQEVGVQGLAAPAEVGGMAGATVDLAVALEEAGRVVYPGPLLTSIGWAMGLLTAAERSPSIDSILKGLVSGDRTAAVVDDPAVHATDGVVEGEARWAVDAPHADDLLIIADLATLVHVPRDAAGVSVEQLDSIDPSRPLARVRLQGVSGTVLSREAPDAIAHATDRARALLAVEIVGGMRACLDAILEYVNVREQFGHRIGSFQAVQHRIVEVFADVEQSAAGAYHAVWCADAEITSLPWAAAVALATAVEAYQRVARATIQLHGGLGFTWEHLAHRHFRRAMTTGRQLGSTHDQHERLLQCLGR